MQPIACAEALTGAACTRLPPGSGAPPTSTSPAPFASSLTLNRIARSPLPQANQARTLADPHYDTWAVPHFVSTMVGSHSADAYPDGTEAAFHAGSLNGALRLDLPPQIPCWSPPSTCWLTCEAATTFTETRLVGGLAAEDGWNGHCVAVGCKPNSAVTLADRIVG